MASHRLASILSAVAENPFHYGTPALGPNFVGRASELDAVMSRIRSGINVVVVSPRRYGKTSLLIRARELLAAGRPKPAIVDTNVFLCKDLATLAGRLLSAAYRVPGARWHRVRQAVPEFLSRLRVRPAVTFDETGKPLFSFGPGIQPAEAERSIADVYSILAEEAAARPAALVLDEFQAVTRHGEHLPFLLKGLADEHPGVSLVLAGSQRHLMERLVTSQGAPLFGMAQRVALGPVPGEEMVAYLVERAATGGKPMDQRTAELLVELAGPVPNDLQHLAFEAFQGGEGCIGEPEVFAALDRTVSHESDLYAERLSRVSPGQARVLIALAAGYEGAIFTGAFAATVSLAGSQSVSRAIDALAEDETVTRRGGRWVINDPFFAAWLRQAT